MKDLNRKAIAGLLRLIVTLAAILFVPAWTLHYWQAWIFLAVFSVSVLAITIYLIRNDPRLLQRRMNAGPAAEKESSQKLIQFFATLSFVAIFVFAAIDHRFAWSQVPPFMVAAGDILVALGLLIVFFVFKGNTFAAAIIEVGDEQEIIATGPYAVVRHPMYIGAIVMLSGIPLALGSWWGLFTIIPITFVIVRRLLDEETFLVKNLPGYSQYRNKVRCRLVPFIW